MDGGCGHRIIEEAEDWAWAGRPPPHKPEFLDFVELSRLIDLLALIDLFDWLDLIGLGDLSDLFDVCWCLLLFVRACCLLFACFCLLWLGWFG
jgi:hypothetical protein